MNKFFKLCLFVFTIYSCSEQSLQEASVSYSESEEDYFIRHITYLSDDSFAGRWLQDNGIAKTEEYVKNEFKKIGLQPLQPFSDFYQEFKSFTTKPKYKARLNRHNISEENIVALLKKPADRLTLAQIEISCFKKTESLHALQKIHAQSVERDKNYLVLVPTNHRKEFNKFKYAVENHGLLGEEWLNSFLKLSIDEFEFMYGFSNIVYVLTDEESVDDFEITYGLTSVALNNIIGYLPGKSLSEEHIIISAHMDHLGKGFPDGQDNIYNGANDNASGIAAMLTLAKYYATTNLNERGLIFIAFNGRFSGI